MLKKLSLMLACLLLFSVNLVMAQTTTTTIDIAPYCEGNLDCDQDVDGTDAALFKQDFGRSALKNPCYHLSDCPSNPWQPCPEGMIACGPIGKCVNPLTDEANCGGCNVTCNGTCIDGVCQTDNPLPDLIIQKMVINPIQPKQGLPVIMEITIKNQGQAASPEVWIFWWQHLDAPPSGQGPNQWMMVPPLAPSATWTWTTGSLYFNTVGDFTMYAQVDATGSVTESIEDNNVYGPYGYHVAEGCVGTLSPLGRWCDQNNGTVKDMTTGLVWLKDAGWGGTKPWREEGDWTHNDDAHTRAGILYAGMSGAGLSDGSVEGDWRLPTKSELVGITVGDEYIRSSQMYFFTNVQSGYYWSSTTYAINTVGAWDVSMGDGYVNFSGKRGDDYVWPVRGGQ